jgi:hypothetical protein
MLAKRFARICNAPPVPTDSMMYFVHQMYALQVTTGERNVTRTGVAASATPR